ncbi:MAG TPA: hypothetical protein VEB20_24100 [Azospirillaceae bacterium]|nr:hypothetical protein [Azospirillaceae bacterium]
MPDHDIKEIGTKHRRREPLHSTLIGIVVGCCILALAVFLAQSPRTHGMFTLSLCVGFSIILGALGTEASIKSSIPHAPAYVVGGAGATAILLFLFATHHGSAISPSAIITISGLSDKIAHMSMRDSGEMFSIREKSIRYRFYVISGQVNKDYVEITVERSKPRGESEQFTMFSDRDDINRIISKDADVTFFLDYDNEIITDKNGNIIFETRDKFMPMMRLSSAINSGSNWQFVSTALAQEHEADEILNIDDQIKSLLDDDTTTRRLARETLVYAGPNVIPALMNALNAQSDSYRIRLGVSYVISRMLRENPNLAPMVAGQIKDEELANLGDLVGDNDKTIRLYAAEALYLLRDKRLPSLAIEKFSARMNNDMNYNYLYNWAVIFSGNLEVIEKDSRAGLKRQALEALPQNANATRELIETIPIN